MSSVAFSPLELAGLCSVTTTALIWLSVSLFLTRRQLHRAVWRADHDALTGVLTRTAFEERARAMIETGPLACVFLDLNDFKLLNDTAGHAVGDTVLQRTARLLTQHLEAHGIVGRRGGDEFLALIRIPESVPEAQHTVWIDELLAPVRTKLRRIHHIAETDTWISAAIGVHISLPVTRSLLSLMYRRADVAMYHAKHNSLAYTHWQYAYAPTEKLLPRPRHRLRDRDTDLPDSIRCQECRH